MKLKPGTLCIAYNLPSLYHTINDIVDYAWSGLTPPIMPNVLQENTPALYVRDLDLSKTIGISNVISEVIIEDKVVMIFKEDLVPWKSPRQSVMQKFLERW